MSLLTLLRHRSRTEHLIDGTSTETQPGSAAGDVLAANNGCLAIAEVRWREAVRIEGKVRSVRVQPWADVPTLECTLVDDTGGITVVFLGRRRIAGIHPGTLMSVEGVAGSHRDKLAMLNPDYTLREP